MYNLLVGGAAGQGVETTAAILERLFKDAGCGVFSMRDLMSRIRGGHNFTRIRFGSEVPTSHSVHLDGVIAMNEETVALHLDELREGGFVICDDKVADQDPRLIKMDMDGIAKGLGNVRAAGSVGIGAALKLFGFEFDAAHAEAAFGTTLRADLVEINVRAVKAGYDAVEARFERPGGNFQDNMLVSGNAAIALGALAGNMRFYSAYPMSPSTGILVFLSQTSKETGIVVEQAEDEVAAINMALGASFAGARAMTGTSGGGFSLMVEGLGLSGMGEIPLVLVDAQRPGPTTGLPTRTEQSDLLFMISASQGEFPRMVIGVRHHLDAYEQTIRALNIAEKYQIPVILLTDQYLADATATVRVPDAAAAEIREPDPIPDGEYLRYRYTESGISPRIIPGDPRGYAAVDSDEHDESGRIIEDAETRIRMMDKRMRKAELLREELQEPEVLGDGNAEVLLIGWGTMYGPLREAITLLNAQGGARYGALVFGDVWPLPTGTLLEKAKRAKTLINVEQNFTGQLGLLIRQQTGIAMDAKVLRYDGRQMSGEEIAERVREGGH
ncbi:MAG TPA: 2-oxoacid:acceptor oxidoreductase subunit alpha [Candidatus Limnocylindria bacterium]|nr:2-oxoacid:acceptor oxidoreductase subunit alpha [Candidatus Limnocylindria bacterium]